jgi:hypothetical protein
MAAEAQRSRDISLPPAFATNRQWTILEVGLATPVRLSATLGIWNCEIHLQRLGHRPNDQPKEERRQPRATRRKFPMRFTLCLPRSQNNPQPRQPTLTSAEEGGQAPGDLACIAAREQRQITTAGLVPAGLPRLRISPGHSGASRLTRPGHRRIVWPHEIPDSGISHRNAGSSPRSGTEAGDISPVFAALEHAAGDFTTLGTDPSLECSSPPRAPSFPRSEPYEQDYLAAVILAWYFGASRHLHQLSEPAGRPLLVARQHVSVDGERHDGRGAA